MIILLLLLLVLHLLFIPYFKMLHKRNVYLMNLLRNIFNHRESESAFSLVEVMVGSALLISMVYMHNTSVERNDEFNHAYNDSYMLQDLLNRSIREVYYNNRFYVLNQDRGKKQDVYYACFSKNMLMQGKLEYVTAEIEIHADLDKDGFFNNFDTSISELKDKQIGKEVWVKGDGTSTQCAQDLADENIKPPVRYFVFILPVPPSSSPSSPISHDVNIWAYVIERDKKEPLQGIRKRITTVPYTSL